MAASLAPTHQPAPRAWPRWALDAILWTLFLGPLISPLFRASGLPLVADAGLLARDLLATYVCPTPDRSPLLLGLPMAVCARCWGATMGLWAARLLVAGPAAPAPALGWFRALPWAARLLVAGPAAATPALRWFRALPWGARLLLAALPFLLWPLEIVGHYGGWWHAPLWLLVLNGAQAGLAAGLFFCSLWPGLWNATVKMHNGL